eukprot:1794985-Prymnesium_polylepis.2
MRRRRVSIIDAVRGGSGSPCFTSGSEAPCFTSGSEAPDASSTLVDCRHAGARERVTVSLAGKVRGPEMPTASQPTSRTADMAC